jgi:hypothetical protein
VTDDRRRHEDDEARLAQWHEFVATADQWLAGVTGCRPTGTVDGLVDLWRATYPLFRPPRAAPAPPEEFPAWARWHDVLMRRGTIDPFTYTLVGAVAAHYGTVLIRSVGEPRPAWEILYDKSRRMLHDGQVVVARPKPRRRGVPVVYAAPVADVNVLASRQLSVPQAPGEVILRKDDPHALRDTLLMRVESFG